MKKHSTSRQVQIFDTIVGLISRLFKQPGAKPQPPLKVSQHWQGIEELLALGGPAHFKQAVVEADKLLQSALTAAGYQGTVADKLRAARNRFSPEGYQNAWEAHKLRNRIVHEHGEIFYFEANKAIRQFKQAIDEVMR